MNAASPWRHTTVLLTEAVEALVTQADGIYLDGTFGRGGHARAILDKLSPAGRLVAFDKDPQAVAAAAEVADPRLTMRHASFADMAHELSALGIRQVQGVLLDLGVSSPQIDDPARGFSFRHDAPLDMRMDTTRGETAAQFLEPLPSWPSSWLARSRPASRARTLQRAHFRLFGFTSTPSLRPCSKG